MSTRTCADRSPGSKGELTSLVDLLRPAMARLAAAALLFFFLSSASIAAQLIVLNITVNGVNKGEFYAVMGDDGDFLLARSDLAAMGFKDPSGKAVEFEGASYLSLRSMEGVEFSFDEKNMALGIEARPGFFWKRTIDLSARRPERVLYPRDTSAFLNYRLNFLGDGAFKRQAFNVNNQLGARHSDYLFLLDTYYTEGPSSSRFVRLSTNVTYEKREEMIRAVAGDFVASSRELGSSVNMAGVSLSKVYRMDPYFIKYPTLDIVGVASAQSDVEVYIDGIKLLADKIDPGEFELKNISRYTGTHTTEVVIKDPYGGIRRIREPFYVTEALLKKGLHEFSYNLGLLRKDYGIESNSYSDVVLSFFHLWGAAHDATIGIRGEAGGGVANAGGEVVARVRNHGVAGASLSAGRSQDGKAGAAVSVNHSYSDKAVSTRLLMRGFTRYYEGIGDSVTLLKTKAEAGAGVSWAPDGMGTFSLDYSLLKRYGADDSSSLTAGYTKSLWNTASLFATFKRRSEAKAVYEAFLGLVYTFKDNSTASAYYQRTNGGDTESVQFQRPAPSIGEGAGARMLVERSAQTDSTVAYTLNPAVEYNSRYAALKAEYKNRSGHGLDAQSWDLSVAGALAYVGGATGFTRPIHDSFAAVKTGALKDVGVLYNGALAGSTDAGGVLFVPYLSSYYDNQIAVKDDTVPIEYNMTEVSRTVSPPLRSGSCISFSARRTRSYSGYLKAMVNGALVPLEFHEASAVMGGRTVSFTIGKGGEFYFESPGPVVAATSDAGACVPERRTDPGFAEASAGEKAFEGAYRATVEIEGGACSFVLDIGPADPGFAEASAAFVDLGDVVCAEQRDAK